MHCFPHNQRWPLGGWVLILAVILFTGTQSLALHEDVETGKTESGLVYWATGSGPAVVFIHCFSLDSRMWKDQVDLLKGNHRVVWYDVRAHGKSAGVTKPYTSQWDLAEVMDALKIEKASLVGLSSGARAAADFAILYPKRVDKLILASPGISGYEPVGNRDWFLPIVEAVRAKEWRKVTELWIFSPLIVTPQNPSVEPLVRQMVEDNAGLWQMETNPERPMEPSALERITELRAPTLLLVGERDVVDTHRAADVILRRAPNARKEVAQEIGHLINLEAPEWFNDQLKAFLK